MNSRFSSHDVFCRILTSLSVISLPSRHPNTWIKTSYTLKLTPGVVSDITEQCRRRLLLPSQLPT